MFFVPRLMTPEGARLEIWKKRGTLNHLNLMIRQEK